MNSHDRLTDLLGRWQEAFLQGQDLSADELCRDCPDLADAIRRHIEFQKKFGRTADEANAPTDGLPQSLIEFQKKLVRIAGETNAPTGSADAPPDGLPPSLAELLARHTQGGSGFLGRYRIERLLGQGGMGVVLLADDTLSRRRVALKFMKPGVMDARERFLREARSAAALEDDHVVRIYHVDEIDGTPYLVMPYLQGESLDARLRRAEGQPLPPAEVLQIGREAALGLAAAHARGLVHRDIKPANLWLEHKEGEPAARTLVLDFGLARPLEAAQLTQTGGMMGTPGYMAPEQADGLEVGPRADLFSLGCVLYRLSTGRPAFQGETRTALLRAVAEQVPPPAHRVNPDVPPDLSDLIRRLLAKDPARRPASAREVADALETLRRSAEVVAPTVPLPPPADPAAPAKLGKGGPRWRPRRWAVVAPMLLLALGGVVVWALNRPGPVETVPEGDPKALVGPGSPQIGRGMGSVDIRIWRGPDGAAEKLRLGQDGALPLYKGDKFRVEANVEVPAYLYLFWINTEGKVLPLYPWAPGKWGTRPAEEQPVRDISLPVKKTVGYEIKNDVEGMETLLLLARETPLPLDDAALQKLFAGIEPQRPIQNPRSAVWFENGKVVEGDPRRKRDYFDTEVGLNDPVLRLQALIEERLQPQASFTSAVSFARLGKKQ